MLGKLWNRVNHTDRKAAAKYGLFCLITGAACGVIGLLVWLVLRNRALNSADWGICFAGYPALAGVIAAVFYSFNHNFRSGRPRKASLVLHKRGGDVDGVVGATFQVR